MKNNLKKEDLLGAGIIASSLAVANFVVLALWMNAAKNSSHDRNKED